jgi:hypothetical protein
MNDREMEAAGILFFGLGVFLLFGMIAVVLYVVAVAIVVVIRHRYFYHQNLQIGDGVLADTGINDRVEDVLYAMFGERTDSASASVATPYELFESTFWGEERGVED